MMMCRIGWQKGGFRMHCKGWKTQRVLQTAVGHDIINTIQNVFYYILGFAPLRIKQISLSPYAFEVKRR